MNIHNFFYWDDFLQLFLLICFSIPLSIIGSFLLLQKKTMVANAISHTVLFGIALMFIIMKFLSKGNVIQLHTLNIGLYILVAIITAGVTLFFIEMLKKHTLLGVDASIAFVFSTLFALGSLIITIFTRSSHVGVDVIMGNLDLVHSDDVYLAMGILGVTSLFVYMFFMDLQVLSFDRNVMHFSLKRGLLLDITFLFLTALIITAGFRFIGMASVLGLIIIPSITGSLFSKSIKEILVFTIFSNIAISALSISLAKFLYYSFDLALSTTGILVTIHFLVFQCFLIFKKSNFSGLVHIKDN